MDYINLRDMFDGGGPGRYGDRFEGGGLLSLLANSLIRPAGYRQRQGQQPMATPPTPRPVAPVQRAARQPYTPQATPLQRPQDAQTAAERWFRTYGNTMVQDTTGLRIQQHPLFGQVAIDQSGNIVGRFHNGQFIMAGGM